MSNEREFISYLVGQQRDCEFSLKFALRKEKDIWKNIFTMLKVVKKGTTRNVSYDYGECIFQEKVLSIERGLDLVLGLYQEGSKNGKLAISNYDEFEIVSSRGLEFVPSKHKYGILKNDWPLRTCTFNVEGKRLGRYHGELLKEGFPYYPSIIEAVIDFFDLETEHFDSYGQVHFIATDYRARIESLKLIFSEAELRLDSPEIKYKDLVIKVFAKSGMEMTSLPDIYPNSESIKFDIGFQPDILSAVLLSRQDNLKIDGKEFTKWRGEEAGILIERPEEEIISLTRAGESQDLEYKYDVVEPDQKNDFIESIVAFLNTNRGIVLVGVDDHGSIVGSHKNIEDLQKSIHDSCDPPPTNVKIEEKEITGKKVIIVDVPEGDDKPYQSKRDKNWYIRHNANDMKMERSELYNILNEYIEQSQTIRP